MYMQNMFPRVVESGHRALIRPCCRKSEGEGPEERVIWAQAFCSLQCCSAKLADMADDPGMVSSPELLPLSDDEMDLEPGAIALAAAVDPGASALGRADGDSPDMLPLSDDDFLAESEIAAMPEPQPSSIVENEVGETNPVDSAFSLDHVAVRARGRGRAGKRGRPSANSYFSLAPASPAPTGSEVSSATQPARVPEVAPRPSDVAHSRKRWDSATDLGNLEMSARSTATRERFGRPPIQGGFAVSWPLARQLLAARDCAFWN